MTKSFNFGLKVKGVVGRMAHAKSSDLATPPIKLKRAQVLFKIVSHSDFAQIWYKGTTLYF